MDETREWARERAKLGKGKVLREEAALVQQCLRRQLRVTWAVAAEPARLSWLRARTSRRCNQTHLKFQDWLLLCPTGQALSSSLNTQDDRAQTGIQCPIWDNADLLT